MRAQVVHTHLPQADVVGAAAGVRLRTWATGASPLRVPAAGAPAAGVPVVATRVGGVPEIVTRDMGVLVAPRPDPIADALAASAGDPQRRERLGAAARARCLAGFEAVGRAGRLREVDDSVLP